MLQGTPNLTHIFSEPEMADGIATSAFFRAWRSAGVTAVSYFYAGVCLMREEGEGEGEPAIERLSIWRPLCARLHAEMKLIERRRRVRALHERRKRDADRAKRAVSTVDTR